MQGKAQIIQSICVALLDGDETTARDIARRDYPFTVPTVAKRTMTDAQRTTIFIRDGFTDVYSGEQLVYPGAIILLSVLMPEEFPSHPAWKMDESHIFYWELWPTIDHVIPIARGGVNDASNWVCTSMIRNGAKANWLLEEIGWTRLPPGDFASWDGLMHWFTSYVDRHPQQMENREIKKWYDTARRCLPAE